MISQKTFVVIYLSIALSVFQFLWLRAEKRAAYLEGRQSVYTELAHAPDEEIGTPLSKPKGGHK